MHIHDTMHVDMTKHTSSAVQFFVFLDVALVVCLLSMMFCLRPFEFTFVSEWMRQCKYEEHWSFLPYLVVVLLVLVASLQLNWMHIVSLCYCDAMCETNHDVCRARRQVHHRPVSRTDMLAHVIVRRTAQPASDRAAPSADAACMCTAAVVCGIVAVIHFDWTSEQSWWHFYGVFLFCSGFFAMLQIIWINLQTACCVGKLRNIKLVAGMHWMLDTIIILLVLGFLAGNFLLGQTGALVVSSELIAFALLMLQFVYLFNVCCRIVPNHKPARLLPARSCNAWVCAWFLVIIVLPFALADNL